MAHAFSSPVPLREQVNLVLAQLAAGAMPSAIERPQVDFKEEPGRRGAGGAVRPGDAQNDAAALYFAAEMACLANTAGGGALIVGIADNGQRIGTALDADWLRHRVYELTERRLTIGVAEVSFEAVRLLVLETHPAIEPIRCQGRYRWRVADRCVEMDPTSWHAEQRRRAGFDWSAEPSEYTLSQASPAALDLARRFLHRAAERGDASAGELATATDADLLRRLHVADGQGRLTRAGALLFVRTPEAALDYLRREVGGGHSVARVRLEGPLLEQLARVDAAVEAANRLVHTEAGLVHAQARALPPRVVREAIVNGIVHRDWLSPQPTVVEHIADRLTVTSPGGFIGGIRADNIITHPAVPRYRSLAEAVASLRLAEREGIGIDRMVGDMIARGHPAPVIEEIAGPAVRVALVGGEPDRTVTALLASVTPRALAEDVDVLLLVQTLMRYGWVDVVVASSLLQRSRIEAEDAIGRLAAGQYAGSSIVVPVVGTPVDHPDAYRFSDVVRSDIGAVPGVDDKRSKTAMILHWARARGRVSSSEVSDLTGVTIPYAGTLLTGMMEDGLLTPGRAQRRGRGFFYIPA